MATLLLGFLFSNLWTKALAAPLTVIEQQLADAKGDVKLLSTEKAPSWASTSDIRGSSDLLWSCTLTLSICVYTVMHLNVPPPGETSWGYFLRKTKWVLIAIFAPEISLAVAYQQWSSARLLKKRLKELKGANGKPLGAIQDEEDMKDENKKADPFSLTYAWYVVMGGLSVNVSGLHDHLELLTLCPSGVLYLAQNGHFLEVDEMVINDKSKADLLAKALVCTQVIWMLIQCIGRKAVGLPLSLLEVHVLVHVACALVMYMFWMKKPLDIQSATIVNSSNFKELLSLMLLESKCSKDYKHLYLYPETAQGSVDANQEFYNLDLSENQDFGPSGDDVPLIQRHSGVANEVYPMAKTEDPRSHPLIVTHEAYSGSVFKSFSTAGGFAGTQKQVSYICMLSPGKSLSCGLGIGKHIEESDAYEVHLSHKDIKRWTLATKAMRSFPAQYKFKIDPEIRSSKCLAQYNSNWANYDLSLDEARVFAKQTFGTLWFWLFLFIMPALYGGVHLFAWNFSFPTFAEEVLWKCACIYIMTGAILALSLVIGVLILVLIIPDRYENVAGTTALFLGVGLSVTWLLAYIASRVFLIVESFISVRSLPIGCFTTVPWSDYIPHL